ncbi:MAG TPA: TAXI family TRAP transporter solute-binding subunit [Hyphomicrobiaceae bacterium]|jgi:TRAP transporter TAXI family solute receptor|nr:TAXI family TRAP transporter solute-binding subunit [Hyphomicrobiaceae bacterium]
MKALTRTLTAVAAAALYTALQCVPASATGDVSMRCAPFGSIIYVVGNAVQDLAQKNNLPFKVVNGEGPGSTAVTRNMLAIPEWKTVVGCTSVLDLVYARRGTKPFFETADPDVGSKVKILFNAFYGAVGILTLDPNLKTLDDLNGKRLALGKISQAHWGGLPILFLETGAPNVKPKMEYLGPAQSHDALAEGRADAVVTQLTVLPDGSKTFLPGVVSKLLGLGKPVYMIGFDDAQFAAAQKAGVDFKPIKINKASFPQIASDKEVNFIFAPAALSVNKDFPEDVAYAITKLVIANAGSLPTYAAMLKVVATPAALLGNWTEKDLHPGAARAFREAGVLK